MGWGDELIFYKINFSRLICLISSLIMFVVTTTFKKHVNIIFTQP
jgi:hypothetical protein